jgi:hypothetical protein
MLESWLKVKVTDEPVPDLGTLPAPVHPVHTYRVPVVPAQGEVTEAVTDDPEVNHPLVGIGEP